MDGGCASRASPVRFEQAGSEPLYSNTCGPRISDSTRIPVLVQNPGLPDRRGLLNDQPIPPASVVPNPDSDSDGVQAPDYVSLTCHDENLTVARPCTICHNGIWQDIHDLSRHKFGVKEGREVSPRAAGIDRERVETAEKRRSAVTIPARTSGGRRNDLQHG